MKKIIASVIAFAPTLVFAQSVGGPIRNTNDLASWLRDVFTVGSQLILAAAVVYFLWGVFKYVKSAGDEKAQETGKQQIIYGVIGIAVMVSIWGLVNFLTSSARLDNTVQRAPQIPY